MNHHDTTSLLPELEPEQQNLPGILGIEVYIPKLYISQTALEEHMKVASGKYTVGLGQDNLSVPCGDVEDINSICLTVVTNLLQKYVYFGFVHGCMVVVNHFISLTSDTRLIASLSH